MLRRAKGYRPRSAIACSIDLDRLRYTVPRTTADLQFNLKDNLDQYRSGLAGRAVDMSSNRSDDPLSAPTPSEGATSFEPIWRFEPSTASEAVWANDLLVETIYRHVYQQGYMKDMDDPKGLGDMINGMLLCKSRFWLIAKIRWEKSWFDELLGQLKSGASLVSSHLPFRTASSHLSSLPTGSFRGYLPKRQSVIRR